MKKNNKDECSHQWAELLAKYKKDFVSIKLAKICVVCGVLKIGTRTIKISKDRLDMNNKPIENARKVIINERLKIPVGTNMYD